MQLNYITYIPESLQVYLDQNDLHIITAIYVNVRLEWMYIGVNETEKNLFDFSYLC